MNEETVNQLQIETTRAFVYPNMFQAEVGSNEMIHSLNDKYLAFITKDNSLKLVLRYRLDQATSNISEPIFKDSINHIDKNGNVIKIYQIAFKPNSSNEIACLYGKLILVIYRIKYSSSLALNKPILEKILSFISLQPISFFRWSPCADEDTLAPATTKVINKILVVHGQNKEWITCWNLEDNTQFKKTIKSSIIACDWSETGNYFSVSTDDKTIIIFDKNFSELIRFVEKRNEKVIFLEESILFTCGTWNGEFKFILFKLDYKKNRAKLEKNGITIEDIGLAGSVFAFYDHLNRSIFLSRRQNAKMYVLDYDNKNKIVTESQMIVPGCIFHSICSLPSKCLDPGCNEIANFWIFNDSGNLDKISLREPNEDAKNHDIQYGFSEGRLSTLSFNRDKRSNLLRLTPKKKIRKTPIEYIDQILN